MKTFLVILALIAVSSAVHNKHINMIQRHLAILAESGYAVDTVLELLNGIKNVQIASLNDATAAWDTASANWEAQIAFDNQQINDQELVCGDIDNTITSLKEERTKYHRYIKDAQHTIESNAETLAARLDARCAASLAYVNKLKANHDAAALLEFLRAQISNPGFRDYLSASQGALAELRQHITHKKHHALSAIAKHHMMALLQQAYEGEDDLHYDQRARSDEEIGNKHHDNEKGALSVDSFTIDARNLDDFIAELLGFIDALIDQIHQDNANLAASEFAAVEDLIAYQDQIEQEAIVLNLYISLWSAHIDELSATIDQNEAASEECHGRLDYLVESLHNDEATYAVEFETFTARRDSLQHTINTLDEVIEVYASKVAGAAEQYKREYDEEIAEKENAGRADNNAWDDSAEEAFFVQRRHHAHKGRSF